MSVKLLVSVFSRTIHRIQDMAEGFHLEEWRWAFRSHPPQDRHKRSQCSTDREPNVPVTRYTVPSVAASTRIFWCYWSLRHSIPWWEIHGVWRGGCFFIARPSRTFGEQLLYLAQVSFSHGSVPVTEKLQYFKTLNWK